MNTRPIKILMLEDNPADAELVLRRVRLGGFEPAWTRVDSEPAYLEMLAQDFELILSDYDMPQFNALRALALLKERNLEIPFILISGTIGEDTAVLAMKMGATDYLLKDRLTRLGSVIEQALEQSVLRRTRRQSELDLFESERRHRLMFDNNPAPMWVYDVETLRFLAVNQAALNHYGFSRDEFLAMTIHDIRPPEEWPALTTRLAAPPDRPEPSRIWRHRKKNGALIQVVITSHQIPFAGRAGQLVIATDVTARTQAEDQLRTSEARLRTVTDNAHVGLVMVNAERRYTFANATYAEFLGLGSRELVGEAVADILPSLYESQIRTRLDRAFAGERVEYELRRPAGNVVRHYAVRYEPAQQDGRTPLVVVVITDITGRTLAEESLRESEERFRQLAESIDEVFWLTDPVKSTMLYISPAYERIWGRTCASLQESPMNWAQAVHPEDRERVLSAMSIRQQRGDYDETYRIIRPDLSERWVHDRAFPVRNAAGEVFRVAGVAQDITEKKLLEAQFFRAQRLESIGTLASGIAHDLNNILAPIMMSAPLIRMSVSPTQTERMLETIESSAQRGAQLVRQLLTFGRGLEGERHPIPFEPLVREMRTIVQQTFPKNITIETHLAPKLRLIVGDATQVHQVLLNLCVNARDAMPDGGRLTLAATNVSFDGSSASMTPGAKPGDYVRLSVNDTGTGMTSEIIDKIFEPFFTTKEPGKGTGLGLATVMGLVKSHEGFLTLVSEVGKGTTFHVHFPVAPAGEVSAAPIVMSTTPRGQGELIVIVDDEANIREAMSEALRKHGYEVMPAQDGIEALAIYSEHAKQVRLVISDLDMPNMNGTTLLRILKKMNSALPVIVSTGLISKANGARAEDVRDLQPQAVLTKPYTVDQLLQAVHTSLTT